MLTHHFPEGTSPQHLLLEFSSTFLFFVEDLEDTLIHFPALLQVQKKSLWRQ